MRYVGPCFRLPGCSVTTATPRSVRLCLRTNNCLADTNTDLFYTTLRLHMVSLNTEAHVVASSMYRSSLASIGRSVESASDPGVEVESCCDTFGEQIMSKNSPWHTDAPLAVAYLCFRAPIWTLPTKTTWSLRTETSFIPQNVRDLHNVEPTAQYCSRVRKTGAYALSKVSTPFPSLGDQFEPVAGSAITSSLGGTVYNMFGGDANLPGGAKCSAIPRKLNAHQKQAFKNGWFANRTVRAIGERDANDWIVYCRRIHIRVYSVGSTVKCARWQCARNCMRRTHYAYITRGFDRYTPWLPHEKHPRLRMNRRDTGNSCNVRSLVGGGKQGENRLSRKCWTIEEIEPYLLDDCGCSKRFRYTGSCKLSKVPDPAGDLIRAAIPLSILVSKLPVADLERLGRLHKVSFRAHRVTRSDMAALFEAHSCTECEQTAATFAISEGRVEDKVRQQMYKERNVAKVKNKKASDYVQKKGTEVSTALLK